MAISFDVGIIGRWTFGIIISIIDTIKFNGLLNAKIRQKSLN